MQMVIMGLAIDEVLLGRSSLLRGLFEGSGYTNLTLQTQSFRGHTPT